MNRGRRWRSETTSNGSVVRGHVAFRPTPPFDDLQAVRGILPPDPVLSGNARVGQHDQSRHPAATRHPYRGRVDHQFGRAPFKWVGELYYKDLSNLIPYEIENVSGGTMPPTIVGLRHRLDMMLNGEFITEFRLASDVDPQNRRRPRRRLLLDLTPTASRFRLPHGSICFADNVTRFFEDSSHDRPTSGSASACSPRRNARNPEYKVLLACLPARGCLRTSQSFKTSCAALPKGRCRFSRMIRQPPVTRLVSLEVFNLLGINNTINYNWIRDVNGRFYTVPNVQKLF